MHKKIKRYFLLGMAMAVVFFDIVAMTVVFCGLTARRSDDYNYEQTESSVGSSEDEGADESGKNVQGADEEEVYEYQQIIDEDGNDGGQVEYSFRFSDTEDAD